MAQTQIRLIRAPNPSPMTDSGTNSWLLSQGRSVAIIDPGPDLAAHQDALLAALAPGQRVEAVLVTHAHLDHSALARPLAAAVGAPVLAFGPAGAGQSPRMAELQAQGLSGGGEGLDLAFHPDECLIDGQTLHLGSLQIEVLHTPGHSANHLCFACEGQLFSGDLAMGWASSLVSPPDGDMGDYMAALRRLMAHEWRSLHPGHGPVVAEAAARLAELYRHRQLREAEVLAALGHGPADAASLARSIYRETPPALLGAATRNVLAHLVDLADRMVISTQFPLTAQSVFHLR